jgi:hypothetical protein
MSLGAEIARPIKKHAAYLAGEGVGCGGGHVCLMHNVCTGCRNLSGSGNMGLSPGREFYLSRPSRAEVKNEWSYAHTPIIRLRGVARYSLVLPLCFFTALSENIGAGRRSARRG